MEIKQRQWKLGVPIIIVGLLLFFIGYCVLLFVPLQDAYVTKNLLRGTSNLPPLLPFALFALIDGLLLGLFLVVGYTMSTMQDHTASSSYKVTLNDLIRSGNFVFTTIITVAIMILITMVWRAQI